MLSALRIHKAVSVPAQIQNKLYYPSWMTRVVWHERYDNEICSPFRLVLLQWLHTAVISVAPGAVVIAANQIAGAFRVGIAVALPLPAKALYPVAAAIVVAGHSPGFVRFPLAW